MTLCECCGRGLQVEVEDGLAGRVGMLVGVGVMIFIDGLCVR